MPVCPVRQHEKVCDILQSPLLPQHQMMNSLSPQAYLTMVIDSS